MRRNRGWWFHVWFLIDTAEGRHTGRTWMKSRNKHLNSETISGWEDYLKEQGSADQLQITDYKLMVGR